MQWKYEIRAWNWGNGTSPIEDFVVLEITASNEKEAMSEATKAISRKAYKVANITQA